MRIAIFHAGAELYGADNVLLTLVEGCARNGAQVDIYLPTRGPLIDKLSKLSGVSVRIFPFPVLRRRDFSLLGLMRYTTKFIFSIAWIARQLRRTRPNLVHSNTSVVLPAAVAAKLVDIPHLWHIHEIVVRPSLVGKFLAFLHQLLSERVIAVSEAVKQQLVRYIPSIESKVQVIYNGVDSDRFHPMLNANSFRKELGLSADDVLVGMIGRVNRWKGQEFLIEAIELLPTDLQAHFVMVGGVFDGEEHLFERLKAKVADKNCVHIRDFRPDVREIHAAFDIFVLPSILPDPLPTVVLEAMATGRPVVATRHGGACEMVLEGETGLLANPTDPADLARCLEQLIRDPQLRASMGKHARTRLVSNFSIERYINDFWECYNAIS